MHFFGGARKAIAIFNALIANLSVMQASPVGQWITFHPVADRCPAVDTQYR